MLYYGRKYLYTSLSGDAVYRESLVGSQEMAKLWCTYKGNEGSEVIEISQADYDKYHTQFPLTK